MAKGQGHATFVHDLATLPTLDERILLDEIRQRYNADVIYTYIGDILVALNPYRALPIYDHAVQDRYRNIKLRADYPPHLYALSDRAYSQLRMSAHAQCLVVSGESGAGDVSQWVQRYVICILLLGKTEATKLLVEHVVHLCQQTGSTDLHRRIVQVNPLLEAFGNAQTAANNNSSRFGKFIDLKFNKKGEILGAHISEYLLEKSRVVNQASREQNFHIFYYLFAGLTDEELSYNHLRQPEQHRILRSIDGAPVYIDQGEFRFNRRQWDKLRDVISLVGFSSEDLNAILALLAAILHLTDITFEEDHETEGVFIQDEQGLEIASMLLQISPEELATALISNVTILRGERIVSLKTMTQANDGRDAMAKSLYGRLFGWIVRQINLLLQPEARSQTLASIGILDIAGFENFDNNSFEQICINAANEQLQFYFNQHIFQWELDEYKREGVKGKDIKFADNKPNIDLFLESPIGLFSLLDEESRFPKATDQSLVDKLTKSFNKKSMFKKSKTQPLHFTINHYAGQVHYNAFGFLEKNRDTLSSSLMECMMQSDSQIVSDLFSAYITDTGQMELNPNAPKRSRKSVLLCKAPDLSRTMTRSLSKKAARTLRDRARANSSPAYENTLRTLGGHFKSSLTDLMRKLLDGEPQFIRCIKPNNEKCPSRFVPELVQTQLSYTGVLETVKIRRQGYATRIPFHVFLERYRFIHFKLTANVEPISSNCNKVMKRVGVKDYEMGKTKVFLKYYHVERLNLLMENIGWQIVHCQALARRWLARHKVRRLAAMAANDARAVMGFCTFISRTSEEVHYTLMRNQEEDNQRYNRAAEEQKRRVTELRKGNASSRPGTAEKPAKKGLFMPTPIILGNPVTGTAPPEPLTPEHPKAGLRRTPLATPSPEFQYPTQTMFAQPARSPRYDDNDTEHYARAPQHKNVLTNPVKGHGLKFTEVLLDQVLERYSGIDTEVWAKIHYMEKAEVVGKVFVRNNDVIIDDSSQEFDNHVFGLGQFSNRNREKESTNAFQQIGKGVQLTQEKDGSIIATRLSNSHIIVKGYKGGQNNVISAEVAQALGRLELNKPLKIFDMSSYKKILASAIKDGQINARELQRACVVAFAFARNTFDDLETPCWISVVNLVALDMLGDDRAYNDLKHMANVRLSQVGDAQLRREWASLRPDNFTIYSSKKRIPTGPETINFKHHNPFNEYQQQQEALAESFSDVTLSRDVTQMNETLVNKPQKPHKAALLSVPNAPKRSASPTYSTQIGRSSPSYDESIVARSTSPTHNNNVSTKKPSKHAQQIELQKNLARSIANGVSDYVSHSELIRPKPNGAPAGSQRPLSDISIAPEHDVTPVSQTKNRNSSYGPEKRTELQSAPSVAERKRQWAKLVSRGKDK